MANVLAVRRAAAAAADGDTAVGGGGGLEPLFVGHCVVAALLDRSNGARAAAAAPTPPPPPSWRDPLGQGPPLLVRARSDHLDTVTGSAATGAAAATTTRLVLSLAAPADAAAAADPGASTWPLWLQHARNCPAEALLAATGRHAQHQSGGTSSDSHVVAAAVPRELRTPRAAIRLAACVVLEDRCGRVLLTQRAAHMRSFPRAWVLAGGGVDPGESLADAAVREVEEEVGLAVDRASVRPLCAWESCSPERWQPHADTEPVAPARATADCGLGSGALVSGGGGGDGGSSGGGGGGGGGGGPWSQYLAVFFRASLAVDADARAARLCAAEVSRCCWVPPAGVRCILEHVASQTAAAGGAVQPVEGAADVEVACQEATGQWHMQSARALGLLGAYERKTLLPSGLGDREEAWGLARGHIFALACALDAAQRGGEATTTAL